MIVLMSMSEHASFPLWRHSKFELYILRLSSINYIWIFDIFLLISQKPTTFVDCQLMPGIFLGQVLQSIFFFFSNWKHTKNRHKFRVNLSFGDNVFKFKTHLSTAFLLSFFDSQMRGPFSLDSIDLLYIAVHLSFNTNLSFSLRILSHEFFI